MATIKACPCCGTPAKLFENHYGTIAEYWVICPECRLGTTWHPSKAEAIAAWNQRATPKPAPEALHGYWQVEPIEGQMPTITTTYCQGCQEKEAELASLRQEKNEAIGAALAVEQRNYDQAQELAALRKLREAAQYVCDCWQIDSDNEHAVVPFGPASMLQDMLAACDEASAPTGDEHK